MHPNQLSFAESSDRLKSLLHVLVTVEIVASVLVIAILVIESILLDSMGLQPPETENDQSVSDLILLLTALFAFLVLIPSTIVSWIGLFKTKWWSRWLYALNLIASTVISLPNDLINFDPSWGLSSWLISLSDMNTGVIIGLLFFSPLSKEFQKAKPSISDESSDLIR